MKRMITIIVMLLIALGGAYLYLTKKEVYVAPEVVTKVATTTIEVDPRDRRIEQREEELSERYEEIKKIEARLDILKEDRESIDSEIENLQARLADFIQGIQ